MSNSLLRFKLHPCTLNPCLKPPTRLREHQLRAHSCCLSLRIKPTARIHWTPWFQPQVLALRGPMLRRLIRRKLIRRRLTRRRLLKALLGLRHYQVEVKALWPQLSKAGLNFCLHLSFGGKLTIHSQPRYLRITWSPPRPQVHPR